MTPSANVNWKSKISEPSAQNFIYNVEDVATKLSEKQPMFRMKSGGVYCILNGGFVRVDKDRRPRRERKRTRRTARMLAEATV